MENNFDWSQCLAHLTKGELRSAMGYLAGFPEHAELYQRCVSLFQQENYLSYNVDSSLQDILLAYQKYYRDAFYLELAPEEAARRLRSRLAEQLSPEGDASLDELEEKAAEVFRAKGFHFLGGRTGGFYGPYIWSTEELKQYAVELPDGIQDYAVKLLDGFVMESWLHYLTFGMSGTGGWSNGDGLIHCMKHHYELDSESFRVSLLKHEAQHAADLARFEGMTSEDLEYRAKLVELIYSSQRRLLEQFISEADTAHGDNGHGLAAERIVRGFEAYLHKERTQLAELPVEEIQSVSRALFTESGAEMAAKYG